MRNIFLTSLAVAALFMTASVSHAAILSEDIAYWYINGTNLDTSFNPSAEWLSQMKDTLVVKVQQTVYDQAQTLSLLNRNHSGDGTSHPGFLYAYTVSNLNLGDSNDMADMGITNFAAAWTPTPLFVTTSAQTPILWQVDTSSSTKPAWKWTSATIPGILPGESVGGFWAVSNISVDGHINANAVHVGPLGRETLTGKTTGPLPDAPSILSLATGLLGLGLTRKRRGK